MARRLDISSGENVIEPPLGNFRVPIYDAGLGDLQAKLIAAVLGAPHLTEHQRASGIPSTVGISTSAHQAIELALSILREARNVGIPLPQGVSIPP